MFLDFINYWVLLDINSKLNLYHGDYLATYYIDIVSMNITLRNDYVQIHCQTTINDYSYTLFETLGIKISKFMITLKLGNEVLIYCKGKRKRSYKFLVELIFLHRKYNSTNIKLSSPTY